ncbi:MAG: multidrug transporter EmrE-like cation transporter [Psychroserpens sp.]
MNILTFGLILCSILLSVSAQILLKHGMSDLGIEKAFQSSTFNGLLFMATHISIIGGLFTYVASAGAWLYVLSKVDVSKAYPFVGLGFVLTMLFAHFFLNEPISLLKVTGTFLIVAGVFLVSAS